MVTVIEGAGTSEADWAPFLAGLHLPELVLPDEPLTLVAPHPDDEVLACGGLLYHAASTGTAVHVVAVTDGEASNPGGSVGPAELARLRIAETEAALAVLGVPAPRRLARPDGGAAALAEPVAALALTGTVLAPWAGDGHPDHEAVGRGCALAAARTGATVVEYPVWAWHWATPADPRIPWDRARRVTLSPAAQAAKAAAIAAFGSQTRPLGPLPADAPVLTASTLARFTRPYEIVFV
ncbi:MAG TPA: PIG-L family deacetylase [Mycobacteriales bacterium]|nr:PIG-L family deacetylase [Mycobacteriales bacterium]